MKSYKPYTKSRRHMTTLPYRELLSGDKPMKSLMKGKKSQAGRNGFGRVTTRHQGGGHKKSYRDVDFRFVYNVELKAGAGARLARSAGNYAEIVAQDGGFTQLKLPSTEIRKVSDKAWASIGAVTNENSRLVNIGKAGRSRWMGIRPTVRGTAMNPVDHPHGGGEGRQGRGLRRAKSMWGKPTGKGQKSRTPKKYSNVFIVSRRKVGKKRKEG
mgnify:CR=1 FL=1